MAVTFGELLSAIAKERNVGAQDLFLETLNPNPIVSRSTFYKYYRDQIVPPFQKGKEILERLGFNIDDETLKTALNSSKLIKSVDATENELKINTGISLRISKLSSYLHKQNDIKRLLDTRISEVSKTSSFSEYITFLIRRDLDERIGIENDKN